MFNSTVLDIVIGLVFIYLLYSLLATIIQEIIATYRNLRAGILKKGIARMLDDESKGVYLSIQFYKHPLIKYLGENKRNGKPGEPAYLTAQNFAKVLIDLLRGDNFQPGQSQNPLIQQSINDKKTLWGNRAEISPETLSYIKSIWADAQGDVEKFRVLLEQWFDDTMERASGWYKKQTQVRLFYIGLSIAIFFNVDTISIAEKLSNNPKLAAQLADNAAVYIQNHNQQPRSSGDSVNPTNQKNIDQNQIKKSMELMESANDLVQKNIKDANKLLGLGWTKVFDNDEINKDESWLHYKYILPTILLAFFGWIITALAISLGAPFWFDLLNKLMKLRSSVASTTPDDKQKQKAEQTPTVKRVG